MYKTLTLTSILLFGLVNIEVSASEEAEQIRQECETQVQSYNITDVEEYKQMLDDCIESLSTMSPMDQDENTPADRT